MIWSERFKKVKKCNGILRERNFSRTFAWLIQALLLAKKERNFNFFRKSVSETTRVLDLSWPSRKGCLRVCPPWLYYLEYQASWNKISLEYHEYTAHMAESGIVRLPFLEPKFLSNQTRYLPSFSIKMKLITWRCAHESLSVLWHPLIAGKPHKPSETPQIQWYGVKCQLFNQWC